MMDSSPSRGDAPEDTGHRMKWWADHLEEAFAGGLLLMMAVLAFINVIVRYLTNYSFAFSEELEVTGLVYLTLFGAAAAFRRGLHLGLSFLCMRFPAALQRLALLLSSLACVGVFAALIYFSILQIRDEMALNVLSEALQLPQWIYTLAVPLGSVFVILRIIQRTWLLWKVQPESGN